MSILDSINNDAQLQTQELAPNPVSTGMSNGAQTQMQPAQEMSMDGPLTLEGILGIDANEVGVYEGGGVWPAGIYAFSVVSMEQKQYDIAKPEDHPFLGKQGTRLALGLQVIKLMGEYTDDKGQPVPMPAMTEKYLNPENPKIYIDSILFGNDGLVKQGKSYRLPMQGEERDYPGTKRLLSMIKNILGEDVYNTKLQETGGNTQALLQAINGKQFACEIAHNVNPNDPNGRVQDQIALFGEFVQM